MRRLPLLCVPALALLVIGPVQTEEPRSPAGSDRERPGARTERASPETYATQFLQAHDRDRDGQLEMKELPKRCRACFDRIDTNKDGKLNREEIARGLTHLVERRRPSDLVFVLVEMSDCDDGCAEEVQRIYSLVRRLDRNQDGKINTEELQAGRIAIIEERVASLFEDLDLNGDDKISKEEARGQIQQHFGTLDTDRDGFINKKELTAAASAKPEKTTPAGEERAEPRR